jgi:hypothetical protein
MIETEVVAGSFRDPSGFLFTRDGVLHRQVNSVYQADYDLLMSSGLYGALVEEGLLISHQEEPGEAPASRNAYKIIRPERLAFVSYPYEWCFSQLRDAGLATLQIQKTALAHGMSLKDASAFNIQFRNGRPVFIDTLSFEQYPQDRPWVAYRQFCQHFLAPLALISHADHRLGQLFRIFLDGVPLDLASALLPVRTRFRVPLLTHLHLHAKTESYFSRRGSVAKTSGRVSRRGLEGILESLEAALRRLRWQPLGTTWADYYSHTNYSDEAWEDKKRQVERLLSRVEPRTVWDLGSNTGVFSRLAARKAELTLAFDLDAAAVERNYLECVRDGNGRVLPLVLDLANPSPSLGWANLERPSVLDRGRPDIVLALALIHHLAIGNNLPLERIARFLHDACPWLLVEFVPKSDSQVQRMLASREDIFTDYTQQSFEEAFGRYFSIREVQPLRDSARSLYLMVGHTT